MGVEQSQSRRSFLALVSGLGAGAIGLVLGLPGLRYIADPLRKTGGKKGRWVAVGQLAALSEKFPVEVPVVGEQVDAWTRSPEVRLGTAWLRREGDKVLAWNAECPHLGCKIAFDRDTSHFGCPCHESSFSENGKRLGGPAPRSLDPLDTRVKDGLVEIRFVRFRAQTPDREEIG